MGITDLLFLAACSWAGPDIPLASVMPLPDDPLVSGGMQQTIIMIISHLVGALLCIDVAGRKYRNVLFWGWIGLLFGPLAAIVLLLLPAREAPFRPPRVES